MLPQNPPLQADVGRERFRLVRTPPPVIASVHHRAVCPTRLSGQLFAGLAPLEPFPDDHELIWLFEAEPTLADPDIVWFYNRLRFVTDRGPDRVMFEVEPASKSVRFTVERDGARLTSAEVHDVQGMTIARGPDGEGAQMMLHDGDTVTLWLKPRVRTEWRLHERL